MINNQIFNIIKNLNPTINNLILINVLEAYSRQYDNFYNSLLIFFNNAKIKNITCVYYDNTKIVLEFINEENENLSFVCSNKDNIEYTLYIFLLAQQDVFGEVLMQKPITLDDVKTNLFWQLNMKFAKSKTIYIQNGSLFAITSTSPQYQVFVDIVKNAINTAQEMQIVQFWLIDNTKRYDIKMFNFFWRLIFTNYYNNRIQNKNKYDTLFQQINLCQSIEALEKITIVFNNPDGYIVNVNEECLEIQKQSPAIFNGNQILQEAFNRAFVNNEFKLIQYTDLTL